jgi:hypothetical protein
MYEPEDEEERELDRLIIQFRSGMANIEEIQQKLLPIIEKFSGTGRKEDKLAAFLQEVIEKINSQQTSQVPAYRDPYAQNAPYQYGQPGYQPPVYGQQGYSGAYMPPQYPYQQQYG